MKKWLKVILIIVGIAVGIILIDSMQALIFNNEPIIGIDTKCRYRKGIFVYTRHYGNGEKRTMLKTHDTTLECIETIDLEKEIKNNIDKILEEYAIYSSTIKYIDNDYYKNIINIGSDAVPVLVKLYESGDYSKNGIDAIIIVTAIQEITNCKVESPISKNLSIENLFKMIKEKCIIK